ncbi:MAG: response regulator [Nitrospirae bacterium]|nr:response regulator [Nitrospirota bacterium]
MKPILVVEDDTRLRISYERVLLRMGYKVLLAEDGEQALSMILRIPVLMVITGIQMPKMDGLALLKEIRHRVGSLPVLVITEYYSPSMIELVMKAGATDYKIKPINLEEFIKTIESIMIRFYYNVEIVTDSQNGL